MMPQKVQLEEADIRFIEDACKVLNYRSRSQYIRAAIKEKIRADRARLREMRRQEAMKAYGEGPLESCFDSLEAEDFEDR